MSIFSRLANAEKLSIPQLQMSIKNGTIPAYAGIPLLEQKVKAAQQAKMTQAPQQAPIADEIMQQANSVQGIQNLQSNLPEESYNDGGIVAFAEGGESFDYEAYQDQADEAEYAQAIANRLEAADSLRVNRTPSVEKPKEGGVKAPPGDFYKNIYNTLKVKAEEMGFKYPEAIARVGAAQSALETGYGTALAGGNNYFGIKGSGGNKQRTKEYSPERGYYSANESFRTYNGMEDSATDYLRLMQNPHYAKVAMAQTPEEAIAAQSRSGYATSPQYGSSLRSIHNKNMAEGGIARLNVPRFNGETGSLTGDEKNEVLDNVIGNLPTIPAPENSYEGPRPIVPSQKPNPMSKLFNALEGQRRVDRENRIANAADIESGFFPGSAPLVPFNPTVTPRSQSVITGTSEYPEEQSSMGISGSPVVTSNPATTVDADKTSFDDSASSTGERRKSEYDLIREDIMNQRNDLKRQKQEDKYLAIIAAGLGIAGGTSPNAFANVGQGAMAGITSYSQAARTRAAENNALNKGLLSAERYRSMDEMARASLKDRAYAREFLAGERRDEKDIASQDRANKLKQDNINALIRQDTAVDNTISRVEQGIKDGVLRLMKADSFADLAGDQINKYNVLVRQELQKAMTQGALKNAYATKQRLQKTLYPDMEYPMPDYGTSSTPSSANRPPLSSYK